MSDWIIDNWRLVVAILGLILSVLIITGEWQAFINWCIKKKGDDNER